MADSGRNDKDALFFIAVGIIQKDKMENSEQNNKPKCRKFRRYSIVLWLVFITLAVIYLLTGSQASQVNKTIILIRAAEELDKDISEFSKSDYLKITELDLSGTVISNLKPLKKFPNLKKLDLSKSSTTLNEKIPMWVYFLSKIGIYDLSKRDAIDLQPLRKLRYLESLILYHSNIKNIEVLTNLSRLQELNLENTNLTDFRFLRKITSLEKLDLTSTEIKELTPISNLKNLRELYLRATQIDNIEPLRNLSNLQTLILFFTPVSYFEPIKGLDNLTTLDITGTAISNIEPILALKNLQNLRLSHCINLTPMQIEELKKAFPYSAIRN